MTTRKAIEFWLDPLSVLVREFKKNSTIFDTITSAEQPTSADEPTDKKLRKVYNVII